MAIYAVGDIQGCCDEFEALLAQLRFDPARDRLWLTGDLVNRGPRSLDVLRLVKRLGAAAITVLGNHDLHLLAAALAPARSSSRRTRSARYSRRPDRDELLTWLRSLPLLHHDAALGYTMIHAGLPPQWDLATAQSCAARTGAGVARRRALPRAVHSHVRRPAEPLVGRAARRASACASSPIA